VRARGAEHNLFIRQTVHLNASIIPSPSPQFIWDVVYGVWYMGYGVCYMASAMSNERNEDEWRETQIKRSILGKFHGLLPASQTNWSTVAG